MYVSTMRGLGVTSSQATSAGSGAAAGAFQIATSPTVGGKISGAGTMILSAAPFAGPAAPIVAIVGAVVAVAGQIIAFVGWGDGCGQNCILTTDWANKAETLLRSNIDAYFSSPIRNQSTQAAALAGFDAIWGQLAAACADPKLGGAGIRCTGDREQGACHFKQTGASPWPGGPALGQCWNWFSAYRDPIANDTAVVPDSVIDMSSAASSVSSSLDSILGTSSGTNWLPILIIGGLALWAVNS